MPVSEEVVTQQLTSNTEREVSLESMRFIAAGAVQKQSEKSNNLNIDVVSNDWVGERNIQNSELYRLLCKIRVPQKEVLRVHILTKRMNHWSAIELQWNPNIQAPYIYVFDAANSLLQVVDTITAINKAFPQSRVYYSGPSTQKDIRNCAYFAIHNLITLSKIKGLFDLLPNIVDKGEFCKYKNYASYLEGQNYCLRRPTRTIKRVSEIIDHIPRKNFPPVFGGLVQNIQSISAFKKASEETTFTRTRKAKLVSDHISKSINFSQNFSIENTVSKYKEIGLNYYEKCDDKDKVAQPPIDLTHLNQANQKNKLNTKRTPAYVNHSVSHNRYTHFSRSCAITSSGGAIGLGVGLPAVIVGAMLFAGALTMTPAAVVGVTIATAVLGTIAVALMYKGIHNIAIESQSPQRI